ncbi:glyoxalase [Streptomyces griseomycini]|nr:glyoxalase [Streptomyces griseomycini]GGR18800.1 glyoxalase [Streptomyces griseomycini]
MGGTSYGCRMSARFDAIGLVVSDMAASVAFYRRLGLAFPEGAEKQGHTEAELPGGLRLMLDTEETVRSFRPGWEPPSGGGRTSLALRCDGPAEVDALFAELLDAGCRSELEPWDAVWGQRYAVVLDPDGNGVDLFAPLAAGGQ